MKLPSFFYDIYSYNSIFYMEEILYKLVSLQKILPNHRICNFLSTYFIEITDYTTPIITEDSLQEIYEQIEEFYSIASLLKEFENLLPVLKNNKKISSRKIKFYKKNFQEQIEKLYSLKYKNMAYSLFFLKKEINQQIEHIKKEKCFFSSFSPSLSTILEI